VNDYIREATLQKKKVLILSDHALSTSGVGTQTRHLVTGLLQKGGWTFRQFGAALKHSNYETIAVNEDFIIKPIDGFGDRNLLRVTLATEKPDAILIFTDPRFFTWLFEMEDEIHQVCPIAWWHVWDNHPVPQFNRHMYEATDLINCHSHVTYEICKSMFPDKTNFIPHAVPTEIFRPLPPAEITAMRNQLLGPNRAGHFVGFWNNRNARRKRPADVLEAWSIFLKNLQEKHGHKNASLVMHTDPNDQEGPNLVEVSRMLDIEQNVIFSKERIDFDKMNILYNITDFTLNISFAEGFGLSTLEAMTVGKPIVALKTGGLTRQVVDHRDGTENGVALPVELKTLVGSQQVPYIYEDYVTNETVADGIMRLYEVGPEERKRLGEKARAYSLSEFAMQKTVDAWHESLSSLIDNWKSKKMKNWSVVTL
jgi:glycosyltransferase involved in cell wall biosynthesis